MPNSRASLAFCSPAAMRRFSSSIFSLFRDFLRPIGSALLGERDPFALPLADERPLELGERAHHRQHEVRHRRVLTGEGQALLDEFDAHAALGELLHQAAQIIEVARQAVHAMHHHGVALAHEGEQPFQLRTLGVLARRLISEQPVHRNLLELAFRVLVEAADADVADALTVRGTPEDNCQEEIYDPWWRVSINSEDKSILTLSRRLV